MSEKKITKKKQQELAGLWGHAWEWRVIKYSQWTDKQEAAWEHHMEQLEKECTEAGIFDEGGEIKKELQAAYRKGQRSAHKL